MSRRTERAAQEAAQQATAAAKTLAARSHEVRQERVELKPEPTPAPERPEPQANPDRIEKLLKARPHSMAMDEIIAKRGLDKEEEEKAPEAPVEAAKEPVVERAPEPQAEAPVVQEAPKTVKVKIDGEESDVPAEEVESYGGIKGYQIAKAAENRLAKANKLIEESRASQTQVAELANWFKQQKQATPPPAPQPSLKEMVASKLDTIRFGTPEEASAAFAEILSSQQPKEIDQNALIQQAAMVIENKRAVEEFQQEFADIKANGLLWRLAISLDNERRAQLPPNQPVDWRNFYRTIGNEIRALAPRQSQSQPATDKTASSTSQPSEKEARKASITVLPTSSVRAEMPKEEKELTPEEERKAWIAEQKKARGQG